MKISRIQSNYKNSFNGAIVNINAISDTHGELLLADSAIEQIKTQKEDLFCKKGKGRANITAVCGDWFMNSGQKGFSAFPQRKLGEFQLSILNMFYTLINRIVPQDANLFVLGNHEFDDGVELISKLMKKLKAQTIATNLDFNNSPAFQEHIDSNKIINEKIIEVDDDKNPNMTHKVLFLGIMPVNLIKYQKNLDGIKLIDNIPKVQADVKREDYEKTINLCKKRIAEFKKENENGIVVLLSHTGVNFADNLVKESQVDLVFDGHEHKETPREINGTKIIPLSQNFKKIVNTKLIIDDDGKLSDIKNREINPSPDTKNGLIYNFYTKLFKDDLEKIYSIHTDIPNVKMLDIKDIRLGNNYLANFITDSILEELKKHNPDVDFLAINSSSMRHPLQVSEEKSISFFDIVNVLAGITEEDGEIMLTEVTGKELSYMVADNYLFNKDTPTKNPIIHYSGLITNRTKILEELSRGANPEDLTQYIIDTNTNEPIEPNKIYKIANPIKYFNKNNNTLIRDKKEISQDTGLNLQQLFIQHFKNSNGTLSAKCDIRIT